MKKQLEYSINLKKLNYIRYTYQKVKYYKIPLVKKQTITEYLEVVQRLSWFKIEPNDQDFIAFAKFYDYSISGSLVITISILHNLIFIVE